jgi:hypothetical protein
MDRKKNSSTARRPGQHKTRCQQITEARLRAQAIRAASKVTHERLDDLMEAVDE